MKDLKRCIKNMELGQSLIIEGKEFVKTKNGMRATSGHKYLIKEIVEFYEKIENARFEVV